MGPLKDGIVITILLLAVGIETIPTTNGYAVEA